MISQESLTQPSRAETRQRLDPSDAIARAFFHGPISRRHGLRHRPWRQPQQQYQRRHYQASLPG